MHSVNVDEGAEPSNTRRKMTRPLILILLCIGMCTVQRLWLAQVSRQLASQSTDGNTQRRESAERRERMRQFAVSVEFYEEGHGKRSPAKALDTPILRFDDNTRENDDGTVWVLGATWPPSRCF